MGGFWINEVFGVCRVYGALRALMLLRFRCAWRPFLARFRVFRVFGVFGVFGV